MVDYEKLTICAASFQRKEKQQQLGPFSQLLFFVVDWDCVD